MTRHTLQPASEMPIAAYLFGDSVWEVLYVIQRGSRRITFKYWAHLSLVEGNKHTITAATVHSALDSDDGKNPD